MLSDLYKAHSLVDLCMLLYDNIYWLAKGLKKFQNLVAQASKSTADEDLEEQDRAATINPHKPSIAKTI